jgi:hypothetical protein
MKKKKILTTNIATSEKLLTKLKTLIKANNGVTSGAKTSVLETRHPGARIVPVSVNNNYVISAEEGVKCFNVMIELLNFHHSFRDLLNELTETLDFYTFEEEGEQIKREKDEVLIKKISVFDFTTPLLKNYINNVLNRKYTKLTNLDLDFTLIIPYENRLTNRYIFKVFLGIKKQKHIFVPQTWKSISITNNCNEKEIKNFFVLNFINPFHFYKYTVYNFTTKDIHNKYKKIFPDIFIQQMFEDCTKK